MKELIKELSDVSQIPPSVVKRVLSSLPEVILSRALKGEKTVIPRLGTFTVEDGKIRFRISDALIKTFKRKVESQKGKQSSEHLTR